MQEPQQSTSPDRRSQARGLQQLLQEPAESSTPGFQTPARPLSVGGRLGLGQFAHGTLELSALLGQDALARPARGLRCMLTPHSLIPMLTPFLWNMHP